MRDGRGAYRRNSRGKGARSNSGYRSLLGEFLAAKDAFDLANSVEVLLRALNVEVTFAAGGKPDRGGFGWMHVAEADRALFGFF